MPTPWLEENLVPNMVDVDVSGEHFTVVVVVVDAVKAEGPAGLPLTFSWFYSQ